MDTIFQLSKLEDICDVLGNHIRAINQPRILSDNEFSDRLYHMKRALSKMRYKLEYRGGLGALDKKDAKMVKYVFCRVEFLVNEISVLSQHQGSNDEYLRALAENVLHSLPPPIYLPLKLVIEDETVNRQREIHKIADMLLLENSSPNPVSIVPVIGIGGTGKTSLARVVYHLQRVVDHFDNKLWVQRVDGKVIFRETGITHERYSVDMLVSSLLRNLVGKKYLLVLDNFLDEDFGEWIDLLEPLVSASPGGKRGSKILVISRSTLLQPDVLQRLPMAKGAPCLLGPLHQDECLHMFNSIAFRGIAEEDRDPHLIDIGVDISNKCANNLNAVRIIASILSSEHTLERWQHFSKIMVTSIERPVECIQLAVDLMREVDAHSRPLLSYLSLFPLGYKFNEVELQQLWEVQGFVYSVESKTKFDNIIEKLVTKGYLVKDKTSYHKAQVVMHEVVKYLLSDECCLVNKSTINVDHEGIQHVGFIADSSWDAPSWLYNARQLKSLFFLPSKSCWFMTIPNTNVISAKLKALQALDLSIVNCRISTDSMSALKQLRYLRLGISFDYLPVCITKLQYLTTLDLRQTAIQSLPESFHKLHSLRHLYTGGRLIDLPPNFAELIHLQTLDVFIVGENNGLDVLASLTDVTGELKICYKKGYEKHTFSQEATFLEGRNLKDLSLAWPCSNGESASDIDQKMKDPMEYEFLQPSFTLKRFVVQGWKGVRFPQWAMDSFSVLLQNLVSIHIKDCYRCQHLPSFSSLSNLNSLQLQGLHALKWVEIPDDDNRKSSSSPSEIAAYFPSLKNLMLANLPQLKGWSKLDEHDLDHQQMKSSFSHLGELRVSGCPKLMSMPLIPSLEKLEVVNIHEKLLKHLLNAQEFTLLKELHINSVHELGSLSLNISSLQVLTIRGCSKLKDVSHALLNLSSLMNLEIECCEDLDWEDSSSWQGGLENLRSLKITNTSNSYPLLKKLGCLTTLKELSLNWLHNVRFLPETIGHLSQLRQLVIQYLPNLVLLPESLGSLSDLQDIKIKYCPRLSQLPKSFTNLESLHRLEIKECIKLERTISHLSST